MTVDDIKNGVYIQPRFFSLNHIEKIESYYRAKFVIETVARNVMGEWCDMPTMLFYSDKPHSVSNSHYFVVYFKNMQFFIADGNSSIESPILGIEYDDKIYHSVYRHDYVTVGSGISIDGGRDYFKISNPQNLDLKYVSLSIKDGIIYKEYV